MSAQAAPEIVISHWSTLIENLQASPLEFYQSVETALQRRQVPETKNDRVDYKEAGLLSAKREYLHVVREKLVFDICGAPFGTGFFVSWWLAEAKPMLSPVARIFVALLILGTVGWILSELGLVLGIVTLSIVVLVGLMIIDNMNTESNLNDDLVRGLPMIGWLYERLFKPSTYYRIDTMLMFQKAVHNAVLEVIDEMTTAKGLRALVESERKPIMREFYQRKVA